MSELTWHEKLSHIRFARLVLFAEKWMSIMVFIVLAVLGLRGLAMAVAAFIMAVLLWICYSKYHMLEDAGGLPTSHLVIRF